MSKNHQEQKLPNAPLLPVYPITLSMLSLDNKVRTMRLRTATIKDAGEMATELSQRFDVFIGILDEANQYHGAFLKGEYIPSDVSVEDMVKLAEAWQADHGYGPTGEQQEKQPEIQIVIAKR